MSQLFLTPIDLGKLELLNPRAQNLAADPGSPGSGQFYFNTSSKKLRVYDGVSAWVEMGTGGGTMTSLTVTQPSAGLTITNTGSSQTTAATATFALANDLLALEGLASTGYAVRTAADTWAQRTLTGTTNQVTVTNGDGTTGNPVFSLPQNIHSAATPTFASMTLSSMGTSSTDVTTKGYVDGLLQGIKWKNSVRAATNAAGTLATSFANGSVIDTTVTLATNDRILIKDQAAPAENGIYIVNAAGAPTRALDMDAWAEVPSATVLVEIGTANADSSWVCTADQGGTIDSTSITFVKMASAVGLVDLASKVTGTLGTANGGTGTASAGTQYGLVYYSTTTGMASTAAGTTTGILHGNASGAPTFGQLVNADITNSTIDLTAKVTGTLPLANGGTGGNSAANAKTALGFTTKYVDATIGGSTTQTVTHNLGTRAVTVQVFETGNLYAEVTTQVECTTTNTVTLTFAVAPAANQYTCVVIG